MPPLDFSMEGIKRVALEDVEVEANLIVRLIERQV